MRYLCALVLALGLGLQWGCTAADKAMWDEAMKEARGENMTLRYNRQGLADEPAQLRAPD